MLACGQPVSGKRQTKKTTIKQFPCDAAKSSPSPAAKRLRSTNRLQRTPRLRLGCKPVVTGTNRLQRTPRLRLGCKPVVTGAGSLIRNVRHEQATLGVLN